MHDTILTMKTIELKCDGCGAIFYRTERRQKQAIRKKCRKFFCSAECFNTHFAPPETRLCATCSKPTTNPRFCTRTCALKEAGRIPNRLGSGRIRICITCGEEYRCSMKHRSTAHCPNCIRKNSGNAVINMTLEHFYNAPSVKNKHPSWKAANVRTWNRTWNEDLMKLPCARCGYYLHIELAHIKPISSFPVTATLGEVNSQSNNIPLCRNCHWEFDHHLFSLQDIPNWSIRSGSN